MDLSKLPSELIWAILDRVTKLSDRKNASLVCRSWNQMLFCTSTAQQNLKLRISGWNSSFTNDDSLFSELFKVMTASERKYSSIEFCYIDFEKSSIAKDFLMFIVKDCCQTLRSLKFESSTGLSQSLLFTALQTTQHLEELHVINEIKCDGTKQELFSLPTLRTVALNIDDDCQFYEDLCWMAPRLEELQIKTREDFSQTRKCVDAVRRFCGQLKKFELLSRNTVLSDEIQTMPFQQLASLKLEISNSFNHKLIRELKSLVNLELIGDVSNELIHDICDIHCLRSLTLTSLYGLYRSSALSQLTKLCSLDSLHISGIYETLWKGIVLPSLSKLHVTSVGTGFSEFLRHSPLLKSLEIKDARLSNKLLGKICKAVPRLEHLTLRGCRFITDSGLQNVVLLENLRELCLTGVHVSSKLLWRRHIFPKLKKLQISYSFSLDDTFLEEIAVKGDYLEQIIFLNCSRITSNAIEELRKRRPSCEIVEGLSRYECLLCSFI